MKEISIRKHDQSIEEFLDTETKKVFFLGKIKKLSEVLAAKTQHTVTDIQAVCCAIANQEKITIRQLQFQLRHLNVDDVLDIVMKVYRCHSIDIEWTLVGIDGHISILEYN